jgi:hypothetical protein
MKTARKSVFHPHDAHILVWLYITVLYIIFCGFEKYPVSSQNPKEFAFGFTEKHLFAGKTYHKSIFHPREANIFFW